MPQISEQDPGRLNGKNGICEVGYDSRSRHAVEFVVSCSSFGQVDEAPICCSFAPIAILVLRLIDLYVRNGYVRISSNPVSMFAVNRDRENGPEEAKRVETLPHIEFL